ncbi:peptidylprolyl isomerase [uncultured Clostridium sp.]|jgi:peptidyl-prolyl cis-trans isomerase C|uniref:peptidylprolyl isomerase n=1 Tax=uncultured Clostridium sp. TaxID=59620 RepID=UPI00260B81CF|nr:peptidylprolyl isomerase [uncultured Clostridium sp.]
MENKVLAVVAGREITENDINSIIAKYPEQQRAMFANPDARKAILEQAIGFELMFHKGQELKIDETDVYKTQLEIFKKELLIQRTVEDVLAKVVLTDAEAEDYYNNNKEEFQEPARVAAKHILMESEDEIKAVKAQIATGEVTFEEAARANSTCPSKEQDGNLGEFSRGMMVPEFENAAFSLAVGEVSEPVQTQFGYHLIKVENKMESSVQTFEDVKEAVMEKLMVTAQQDKYLGILTELEAKYGVDRK